MSDFCEVIKRFRTKVAKCVPMRNFLSVFNKCSIGCAEIPLDAQIIDSRWQDYPTSDHSIR